MTTKARMTPTPRPDDTRPFVVELTEWDQVGPAQNLRLKACSLASDVQSRQLAEALRGRLEIREGYEGLEITSTSFVGRVDVGPLRIAIRPKLPEMPLARLLSTRMGCAMSRPSRRRAHRPRAMVFMTC